VAKLITVDHLVNSLLEGELISPLPFSFGKIKVATTEKFTSHSHKSDIEFASFWTNAVISLSLSSIEFRNQGATRE
jgi:hypothetical protein